MCSILLFTTFTLSLGDPASALSSVKGDELDEDSIVENALVELLEEDSDFTKFLKGIEDLHLKLKYRGLKKLLIG